jgi:hypothetical protein
VAHLPEREGGGVKVKRKPERFMLRVQKGALVPADAYTQRRMRDKGYHVGDILIAELKKPRNPAFHRKVHALGQLVSDNIEAFTGMDAHKVLKRLQIEADIGCEAMSVVMPDTGEVTVRLPQSMSYADMDEGEFGEVYRGFCDHIRKTYWPSLLPEQVEEMAELMEQAA